MLNLVENYDFVEKNALNVHRLIEVLKFGFAARSVIYRTLFKKIKAKLFEKDQNL